MDKIPFVDGTLVTAGYVTIEGQNYEVNEAVYEGDTPLSAFNLNKMQNNIEDAINNVQGKQTAITATMTDNQLITTTVAWQIVKLNLDTITSSEKLTLSGNAVKIGKGVSKILVSANTSFVEQTNGLVNIQFLKNSSTIGKTVQGMSDQSRLNIAAPPQIIEVVEGDLIHMGLAFGNVQTNKTVSSSSTFMTVQVVE